LLVSPNNEENLIIGLENNNIIQANLAIDKSANEDSIKFEYVVTPLHSEKV
jgi:hypothetical protein